MGIRRSWVVVASRLTDPKLKEDTIVHPKNKMYTIHLFFGIVWFQAYHICLEVYGKWGNHSNARGLDPFQHSDHGTLIYHDAQNIVCMVNHGVRACLMVYR